MHRRPRPELLALLEAVKDDPGDRTPWLVLTDWLEEHGDDADQARAEYCRLCLPKMGLTKVTAAHFDLGERRRDLFRTWGAAWLGPLAGCQPKQVEGLFHVQLSHAGVPRTWADADAVREAFAWVRRVSGLWSGFDPGRHAWGGLWADLRELELWGEVKTDDLIAFLERDDFPRLREFGVRRSTKLTVPLARRMVRSGKLERFRHLSIYSSKRDDGEAIELLRDAMGERVHF